MIVYFPQLLSWKRWISDKTRMKLFYCTWGVLFLIMLLGKFEVIYYCLVGDFYSKAMQWKSKMTIEFVTFFCFILLSKGSLFMQNFWNIYAKLVLKRSILFLFSTHGNNRRVLSSIIQILNFSSQPIFQSVREGGQS